VTVASAIGEFIFIVAFIALIFGIALLVHLVDFVFTILYLLYRKIFK